MSVPKSVVKFSKNGVTYTSNVEFAKYSILELTRAALRDVGKFVARTCNSSAMQLKGMKKSKRVRGKTSAFQYWVRKQEGDLQVGIKHNTWYGVDQELGANNQPKRDFLRTAVNGNIAQIVEIESKYLSALESEAEILRLIESEEDYIGGGEDD